MTRETPWQEKARRVLELYKSDRSILEGSEPAAIRSAASSRAEPYVLTKALIWRVLAEHEGPPDAA